ncbi:MAG: beta-ketoacyl-[acyl-carrier-protein] synthase family protein, partial [Planctomycetia bacterium]
MRRRVVVTGIGMIAPLGFSPDEVWENMKQGKSGVGRISLFDASGFPTQIAGEVRNFSLEAFGEEPKKWEFVGRNIEFAVCAAKQAVADSGLDYQNHDPDRVGVYLGAGEGKTDFFNFVGLIHKAFDRETEQIRAGYFMAQGVATLNGYRELEQEPGMSSSHLAEMFNAHGPNMNCLTACAASSQAIGEATEIIRNHDADVMISGGTHSMLHPLGVTGFNRLTALSTRNDDPEGASRPFDKTRDGFVIGEGAGMVVL